jgi:hypothetical protein
MGLASGQVCGLGGVWMGGWVYNALVLLQACVLSFHPIMPGGGAKWWTPAGSQHRPGSRHVWGPCAARGWGTA